MQKTKNIKLLVILAILVTAIVAMNLIEKNSGGMSVDKKLFQLEAQQEITDVYLSGRDINNHFSFKAGRWHLNDSLFLDQSMRDVFFSVLSQVEVRKPIPQSEVDSIRQFILENGIHVEIKFSNELISDYRVGGNKEQEISWMMSAEDGIPYQVHLPGYQSYVAGIFEVPVQDWRSRFIFNINFALLSKIEVEYPDSGEVLTLQYQDRFFAIPDVQADSIKIANFLDQLAYLQADRFLHQRLPTSREDTDGDESMGRSEDPTTREDSSSLQTRTMDDVYARITLTKTTGEKEAITFYLKDEKERLISAQLNDGSYCQFEFDRIKGVFVVKGDFE